MRYVFSNGWILLDYTFYDYLLNNSFWYNTGVNVGFPLSNQDIFAITEFNNCFIIRSPSLFFNYLRSDLPFSRKNDPKKEKSVVSFTHEQNYICNQTQLGDIAHEQTIICKQLFAGNVMGPQPMKRKKNLHRRIFLMLRPAVSRVLLQ